MILYQPQNGYCYNSDTHFLFNFISLNLAKYKNVKGELLDIGSGSGVLGLLLAKEFEKISLNQCEIQEVFQFLSQKNSQTNKIKNHLYKGDFLKLEFNKSFDLVVSNPPFYHSDVIKTQNECLKIARYNDSMPLKDFIKKVSSILTPHGKFFFCYDVKQLNGIITTLNDNKLNLESIQFLHPNGSKEASLVMIMAKKSSKSPLKVYPPLIMFNSDGTFKDEINLIYKKCDTHSIKCEI